MSNMYRSLTSAKPDMGIPEDGKQLDAIGVATSDSSVSGRDLELRTPPKRTLGKRILAVIWDSLDKSPQERALIAKLDWYILTYVCIAYFVKYLDQTNVSTAQLSPDVVILTI